MYATGRSGKRVLQGPRLRPGGGMHCESCQHTFNSEEDWQAAAKRAITYWDSGQQSLDDCIAALVIVLRTQHCFEMGQHYEEVQDTHTPEKGQPFSFVCVLHRRPPCVV